MKQILITSVGMFVAGILAFGPAAAQSRGDRAQQGSRIPVSGSRVETQAQCEARQQRLRDPVSGIRIQAGDAGRFCNRQRR